MGEAGLGESHHVAGHLVADHVQVVLQGRVPGALEVHQLGGLVHPDLRQHGGDTQSTAGGGGWRGGRKGKERGEGTREFLEERLTRKDNKHECSRVRPRKHMSTASLAVSTELHTHTLKHAHAHTCTH